VTDPGVTGADLSPVLRGEAPPPELLAFSHTPKVRSDVVARAQSKWALFARYYPTTGMEHVWVSVRKGDLVYKLTKQPDGSFGFKVYDLARDPEERHDLFRSDDPEHAAMAERLERYKEALIVAHDAAEAEKATREVDRRELEALRELGYVQ
jgi:hypothetical protein